MSDIFLVCYKITAPGVGGPLFRVHLSVYPTQETIHGFGEVTQGIEPPFDMATKLDGCYFPISPLGMSEKVSVSATGYPDINWLPYGGISPVLIPNLKLQMVLDNWQGGVASYKYKDNNDNWQTVTNAQVEIDNSAVVPDQGGLPNTKDFYSIVTTSGNVLDGTALQDGDNVLLWSKKGSDNNNNQKWKLEDAGNDYYFITTTNGKVLDGTTLANGVNVLLWSKKVENNDNQKWKLEDAGNGYYFIITANGLALDGTTQNQGDNVLLWSKKVENNDNQKWRFENPDQPSVSLGQTTTPINQGLKFITISSGNVLDGTALQDGDNVLLWGKKGSDNNNQKWELEDAGNGYYFITTTNGKVLDGTTLTNGDDVLLWSKKAENNDNQKWKLEDAGNGYYFILTFNGLALDGTTQGQGDNVLLWDKTGGDNQKWRFEDVLE